ncbi:MAG: Wzz/FepE/Etk N-terminal domain-containing protein [Candidatus Magasanikbacteria bacterium]
MFLEQTPIKILTKRWRVLVFAGLLVAVLSLIVSILFPLQYRADAQVLIISKSRYGVDPYTVIKSAERVGENISQIVKTNDFFQKVMSQPGYTLDSNTFAKLSERDKRKKWQKTINTSVVYGTGVLNVSAYHENQTQAKQLAGAVADTLVSKGWEYVGGDVTIKVVNDAVVTKWPVRPNLILNTILGFVLGVLVMGILTIKKYFKV